MLISGGGDRILKIWKWREGRLVNEVDIGDVVMPFIKVVRAREGRNGDDDDGAWVDDNAQKLSSRKRRKAKKRQKQTKAKENEENEETQEQMDVDEDVNVEKETETLGDHPHPTENTTKENPPNAHPLLALQKLTSIQTHSSKLILFSAHGSVT